MIASSQAALRLMLRLCEQLADSHGLRLHLKPNLFALVVVHLLTVPVDSHSVVPHFLF